jgi:hypothetical protein
MTAPTDLAAAILARDEAERELEAAYQSDDQIRWREARKAFLTAVRAVETLRYARRREVQP